MNYVVGLHIHSEQRSGVFTDRGEGVSDNKYEFIGIDTKNRKGYGNILTSTIDIENDENYGPCVCAVIHGAKHYYPIARKVKKKDILECKKIKWSDDSEHRIVEKRQFEVIKFPTHLNRKITQLLNQ